MHWCLGVQFPGTGVTDSCEMTYGCWELNLGPLEEQLVFLTVEPPLQLAIPVFDLGTLGWQDGSADKGACHQA